MRLHYTPDAIDAPEAHEAPSALAAGTFDH